jgi:hypothetical protein
LRELILASIAPVTLPRDPPIFISKACIYQPFGDNHLVRSKQRGDRLSAFVPKIERSFDRHDEREMP